MNDFFISQIRTFVPLAVGAVLSWLATKGVHPDITQADMATAITVLTGLLTALYYTVVRLLERFVSAKFGWLLGYAQKPTYVAPMSTKPTE